MSKGSQAVTQVQISYITPRLEAHPLSQSAPLAIHLWVTYFPGNGTDGSIIVGQQFEIQNVDDSIVVQVGGARRGSVVVHPDRQRIELIDDVVPVNVTGQQSHSRFSVCAAACNCGRTLGTEETAGSRQDGVASGRSGQTEGAVIICCDRSHQ